MGKMEILIFDIIFRCSDCLNTEFAGDFYFDFCRISNELKDFYFT